MRPGDRALLERAVSRALAAEREGNMPIGCVVALGDQVVAEAGNAILVPRYDPRRHAEIEAFARVPPDLWPRARDLTCVTTLEPCVMCAGTILLTGIGRVVFGARDPAGGAGSVLGHLPPYYAGGRGVPEWIGPILPEVCDALYERAAKRFDALPCGIPRPRRD